MAERDWVLAKVQMKLDYAYHYRKWHSDDPRHVQSMLAYYRRMLAPHLPADRSIEILDVGCGAGLAMQAVRELGFENVKGIDCDEGQVKAASARGMEAGLVTDSVAYLERNAGRYGAIICLDVIEHILPENQMAFVAALGKALAGTGVFVCTVPNANSSLAGRWRYIDWTHCSSFTEHSLDFLLHHGGFREIRVMEVDYFQRPGYVWLPIGGTRHWWAFRFFRMIRRIQMMAELGPDQGRQVPLSLNLLGVARKS